jgi:hypothetical protein
MKLLRMTEEYVRWTVAKKKTATTRLKFKGYGQFELATGSRYKPRKTGVVIEIEEIVCWTPDGIPNRLKARILEAEHFPSWSVFMAILQKLNAREIGGGEPCHTHFYRLVPSPCASKGCGTSDRPPAT